MTAEYTNTSKQGWPVIYHGKKAPVLFRQTQHQPYVVAHGYLEEYGNWGQGSYLDDLKAAMAEADGTDMHDGNERWTPDPDFLHEAAEALVASVAVTPSYYERYLVAATEWYVQCYLKNLLEVIVPLFNDADIDWRFLSERERAGVIAGIAFTHTKADWDNIDERGDFDIRRWECIANDIARESEKYLELIDD